jgi:D-threo-aldose 1-dehydrogenase
MREVTLGTTGLKATNLCVGTSPLGDQPGTYGYGVDESTALKTLRRVFASPFKFVDTGNGYNDSERRIGMVLSEIGGLPQDVLLATKVDPLEGGPFTGARVYDSINESQARLGLDHLPLVYLHDPERISFADAMATGGPVEAMLNLKAEGVIGHLGVAGGPISVMRQYAQTGAFEVVLTHNRYTLVDRSAQILLDECSDHGIAVVNAAPFASGLLAKGPDRWQRYHYGPAPKDILEAARQMQHSCERFGVPLAAAALQFSMREPKIAATVVGIGKPERVSDTLALAQSPIPEDLWAELEQVQRPASQLP